MFLATWATVRAIFVTCGRPVLQRTLALWAATGLLATVLFAGNGMSARDLTRLFHGSLGVRVTLATMWIVLATPVVSCAFDAPGTRILRSLPVARNAWVGPLLALLLLAQFPCGLLFAQGQRVSLCAAFLGEPSVLVLDEPTNALNRDGWAAVLQRLRGATALVATHDAELVTSLDARVVRMADGRIVQDVASHSL